MVLKMTHNNDKKYISRTPLYDALNGHIAKGRVSMHTPGHKGCAEALGWLSPALDLTELPDTDSLYDADYNAHNITNGIENLSPISAAEYLAARYFGAVRTVFSAGGCSLAIQAMLRCCCAEGDKVIMGRNCHRTAVNACALLGLTPVWAFPTPAPNEPLAGRVTAETIDSLLTLHSDVAAVYITSPDYYGCISDISGISAVCRKHAAALGRDIPLLVDNAHGTHLAAFRDDSKNDEIISMHPLAQGAAFTACSAHKTLPVLTGGAFLSCSREQYAERMKQACALFGSTSPSYLIMASLDLARDWMQREGEREFARLAERCDRLRVTARQSGFSLPSGVCDPVRLTLLTAPLCDGDHAAERLREMGFEAEYSDRAAVVLLLSPFHTDQQLDRLEQCIKTLGEECNSIQPADGAEHAVCAGADISLIMDTAKKARALLPVRTAALSRRETVEILPPEGENICGRIAAASICPCPPGIPLVAAGEEISEQCARLLLRLGVTHAEVCAI